MLAELDDDYLHPDWDAEMFKRAQYIVVPPSEGKHVFYFMPDGTVAVVTDNEGHTTKRMLAHKKGQWVKENIDG